MTTQPHQGIQLIPDFLSPEECQRFINDSEAAGYSEATVSIPGKPTMMKSIRNNDRVNFDSPQLAEQLFIRISPYLKHVLPDQEPRGLNTSFRYYRYTQDQKFKRHIDGPQTCGSWVSKVTFLLYLNADFTGGETIFRPQGIAPGSPQEHIVSPNECAALLFLHHLWHEGAPVQSGCKYVLRTDVYYDSLN